jgi:hypothetical protein
MVGHEGGVQTGLFRPFDDFATQLVLQAYSGSFLGFVLVSALLARARTGALSSQSGSKGEIPRWLWFVFVINVVLGSYQLVYTIRSTGISLATIKSFFSVAREAYIETLYRAAVPLVNRLLSYTGAIAALIPVLVAVRDFQRKVISRRLLLTCFVLEATSSLAIGGRGWLFNVYIPYILVSLYLSFEYHNAQHRMRVMKFSLVVISVLAVLVSLVFFIRSGPDVPLDQMTRGEDRILAYAEPVSDYLGIPLEAISAYSRFSDDGRPTFGGCSFPLIGMSLHRLGVPALADLVDYYGEGRDYVARYISVVLATTHATYIPDLVKDVGVRFVWLAALIVAALFQSVWLFCRQYGPVAGGAALLWAGWTGAMSTAQVSQYGTSLSLLFLLGAVAVVRSNRTTTPRRFHRGRACLER